MRSCINLVFGVTALLFWLSTNAQTNINSIVNAKVGSSMRVYCLVDGKYSDNRLDLTVTERYSAQAFFASSKFLSGMAGPSWEIVQPNNSVLVAVTKNYIRIRIGAVWRKPGVKQHKLIRDYYINPETGETFIYGDWQRENLQYRLQCQIR